MKLALPLLLCSGCLAAPSISEDGTADGGSNPDTSNASGSVYSITWSVLEGDCSPISPYDLLVREEVPQITFQSSGCEGAADVTGGFTLPGAPTEPFVYAGIALPSCDGTQIDTLGEFDMVLDVSYNSFTAQVAVTREPEGCSGIFQLEGTR